MCQISRHEGLFYINATICSPGLRVSAGSILSLCIKACYLITIVTLENVVRLNFQ